jgi:hypothetical protein
MAAGCGGSGECLKGHNKCGAVCVDFTSDPNHCGDCLTVCADGQQCLSGSCRCSAGLTDCSSACVDTDTNAAHCGGCGMACTGGKICVAGGCTCAPGQIDCSGTCADLMTNGSHCGKCGESCAGNQTCSAGKCGCAPGTTLCDVNCANLLSDSTNCGSCGKACATGESCVGGVCLCPASNSLCNGVCVDKKTDNANCGACGTACTGGKSCDAGKCKCGTGLTDCGGTCVDLAANNLHCGKCGDACTGGKTCQGTCQCPVGTAECGGACYAGGDRAHCGPSCQTCTAAQVCQNGCISAPTLSFATRWTDPMGWTVPTPSPGTPNSATFALTPSGAAGITYECRTGPLATVGGMAFTNCDGPSGGSAPSYKVPSLGDGTHRTEVRYKQNGVVITGGTTSYEYYAHSTLNNVAKCQPKFTDAQYFAAATAYNVANPSQFPIGSTLFTTDANLKLKNPFIVIPFKQVNKSPLMRDGIWSTMTAPFDYLQKDLSLRHTFVLDSTAKLLMMKRNYQRPDGGCQNISSMHFGSGLTISECDAWVMNINGQALCIGSKTDNTQPEVKGTPYVAGWFRLRTTRYTSAFNGTRTTNLCADADAPRCDLMIFLPP